MIQCMDSANLHRRLNKITGQFKVIDKMIDEDIPCEDILIPINAAKSALHKVGHLVFCDLSTLKCSAACRAAKAPAGNLDSSELHALGTLAEKEGTEEKLAFTVYDDIREKLVAQGNPRDQIAFIHEANTEVRKKDLFSKVRTGQVRVLMGSTFKMGQT